MTIYICEDPSYTSFNLTMFMWSTFCKMLISLAMASSSSFAREFLFMIFMAHLVLSALHVHSLTVAKLPWNHIVMTVYYWQWRQSYVNIYLSQHSPHFIVGGTILLSLEKIRYAGKHFWRPRSSSQRPVMFDLDWIDQPITTSFFRIEYQVCGRESRSLICQNKNSFQQPSSNSLDCLHNIH